MAQYIIEATHTPAECQKTLDAVMLAGAHWLTNSQWGCMSGDHTAWIIVEADSDAEAQRLVPPPVRSKAKVVRLTRFTPEQIRAFASHAKS
ncbi:MAG: hypothetical protein HY680_11905 [Chloroflexi bacterium]|nr:hypothetical protein [Chloroflexota bacterium]